jgi:hypothetical protein
MRLAAMPVLVMLLGVGALAVSGGARAVPDHNARTSTSSHLQVVQVEYRLMLSRGVVKAGPLDLEVIDAGMDPHDLRVRRIGSKQETSAPELTSGRRWATVVSLKPGVYRLWCSLPEHAGRGMRATLRVTR